VIDDATFDDVMELVVHGFEIAGVAVLVRTFLSFSLEVELEGTLPWRRENPRTQSAAEQS
jgi:hypothetical protein